MIFPRPTIRIGRCIAISQTNYQKPGKRPRVNFRGERWVAARVSYYLNKKTIPRTPAGGYKGQRGARFWFGKQVLHTCNHEWCIHPSHLYLGGHRENSVDRWNDATEDEKKRFKKKMKRLNNSPEHRRKLSLATRGIPKTEEHKRKISLGHRRRKFA